MRGLKVCIFVFSLFIFIPSIVNAQCNYNEKSKLQSLAGNVSFSYDYEEKNNGIDSYVDFRITISNVNPELYVVDQTNISVYRSNGEEIVINNYKPGSTIQFIIYGNAADCKGVELATNYITLPPYNRFYKDQICDGANGYSLCNRWTRVDLSYEEFINKVNEYKKRIKVDETNKEPNDVTLVEKVIYFLSRYSFFLFGGIIIICSGLMFYLKRKDDFDLN